VSTAAGKLVRAPITTACLSSGFGTPVEDGKSETHPDVDYYNRAGGPIYAAGDGVVTFAGEDPSYGFSVLIDHGSGVEGTMHTSFPAPSRRTASAGRASAGAFSGDGGPREKRGRGLLRAQAERSVTGFPVLADS